MKDIIRYTDGDWYVIAREHGVAVLPPSVPSALLDQLWVALDDGGLSHIIEALTVGAGLTLWELPPFAVAVTDGDDVRVAVRGDVRLSSDDGDRHDEITGGQAHTWVEQVVPASAALVITPPNVVAGETSMPLTSGVVRGGAVTVGGAAALRAASPAARRERRRTPADAEDSGAEEPAAAGFPDTLKDGPEIAAEESSALTDEHSEASEEAVTADDAGEADEAPVDANNDGGDADPAVEGAADASHEADVADEADENSEALASDDAVAALSDREVDAEFAALTNSVSGEGAAFNDHDGLTIDHSQLPEHDQMLAASPLADEVEDAEASEFLGRIVLSTGRVLTLERSLVIGRRPRITRTTGNAVPALVTIDSPTHDISRNHVEIRREGDMVLVTDLDTTNGTLLLRGQEVPRRLHPGEATLVVNADVIDIGDGVTITFEDLP